MQKDKQTKQMKTRRFRFLNSINNSAKRHCLLDSNFANRRNQAERKYLKHVKKILRESIENEQVENVIEILSLNKILINTNKTSLVEKSSFYTLTNEDNTSSLDEPMATSVNLPDNENKYKTSSGLSNLSFSSSDSVKKVKTIKNIRKIDWSKFYIDPAGENNPLHYASRLGKAGLIDPLLSTGHFNINQPNRSDAEDTALTLACDIGSLNVTKELLARGADSNYENKELKTPLILATELTYPFDMKLCNLLLTNGALVNKAAQDMSTALLR